jgi:hypothetical protein
VTALSSYRLPPWQAPPLPNVGHRGPTGSARHCLCPHRRTAPRAGAAAVAQR